MPKKNTCDEDIGRLCTEKEPVAPSAGEITAADVPDAPVLETAAAIREAFGPRKVQVSKLFVPGLGKSGGYVYIRGISGVQRAKVERFAMSKKDGTSAKFFALFALCGLCDKDGNPVFSDSETDLRTLMQADAGVTEAIGKAVQEKSGLGKSAGR